MANILKETYASYYLRRVVGLYSLCIRNKNEAIYYYGNKIVIVILNEEIGRNLKECLEVIKKEGYVTLKRVLPPEFFKFFNLFDNYDFVPQWFRVTNYYADSDDVIRTIKIKTDTHENIHLLTSLKTISETSEEEMTLYFMYMFNKLGLTLEKEKIDLKNFNESVTKLASYFVKKDEICKEDEIYENWVRYYHFKKTGEDNFYEFYKKVDSEVFVPLKRFKYDFNSVRICYNYYLTKSLHFSGRMKRKYSSDDYTIVKNIGWKDECVETNDFFIYINKGINVKIIKDIKSDFQNFLVEKLNFLKNTNLILENPTNIVINLDEEILGYTFENDFATTKEYQLINNIKFDDFNKMIEFLNSLLKLIRNTKGLHSNGHYYANKLATLLGYNKNIVKFADSYTLFLYLNIPTKERMNMTVKYVFQIYLEYINSKYNLEDDLKSLYRIPEIRCLKPKLVQNFYAFILNKKTDYVDIYAELLDFFINYNSNEEDYLYSKYYIPNENEFYFDYEIENMHNIVFLNKPCSFIYFREKIAKRCEELKKYGVNENDNIKFITYQKLIFSQNICKDGSYECLGYITNKTTKNTSSIEQLLKCDNRELLKIFTTLFSEFENIQIPLEFINIDIEKCIIYINVVAEEFEAHAVNNQEYFKKIFKIFMDKGYNANAFIELGMLNNQHFKSKWAEKYVREMKNYCSEHKIYYSGKTCPACKAKNYYPDFEENNPFFSDEYANHYHIKGNNRYNLKVYKKNKVDMKKMENAVDEFINSNLILEENYSVQDCFIPYKKAIDSNGQFIGYIYKKDDFVKGSEKYIDIEDIDAMPNLPRVKSLIRTILQVMNLAENGYGFIYNPYGKIYLNRNHKKQVQILNIDFLSKKADKEKTLEWTKKYVENIINNDDTINKEIELSENQDISELLQNLQNIAKTMTKYCKVHQIYYKDSFIFCPKCMKEKNITMDGIDFERIDIDGITSQGQIDEGGESYIYDYGKNRIAKILKIDEINYDLKFNVLIKMIKKSAILQEHSDQNENFEYIVPEKLIVDSKTDNITGYVMKKVEDAYSLSALSDKKVVEKCGFLRNDILEILITIGNGIEVLHNENIFIGDLNGRNILFDKNKKIYFIDFDGMGIDDISPEFCTDGYIDPESKKSQNITPNDDWYSFAIQAFYYLTYTHPFNGVFVDDNGKMLDITEKMEQKISLLGNHGIEIPAIAESWDWMSYELVKKFKQIFEDGLRENIVQYLVNQYNILNEIDITETEAKVVRINEKFVLEKINPFTNKMNYFISEDIAIALKKKECIKYYKQDCEYELTKISDYRYIEEATIVNNYMIAIQDEQSNGFYNLYIIDLDEQKIAYSTEIVPDTFYVNNNIVYYLKETSNKICIEEITLDGIEKRKFKLPDSKKIKKLKAISNTKMVMVKSLNNYYDEIYCNNEKLCKIKCISKFTKYSILYDKYSKNWIVINNKGYGVFINTNVEYKRFKFDNGWIQNENLNNVSYIRNNLYIPNNKYLIIVKMPKIFIKKVKCDEISLNSKICSSNSIGFKFITEGILYEFHKE